MQEKFALRKTLKKVAAVGTSLAMMGITVSGAFAAGLGDYPSGLGLSKTPGSTVVVYGGEADMGAATDVVSGLPGGSAVATGGAETTEGVSGVLAYGVVGLGTLSANDLFEAGEEQDIDIADNINMSDNFGNTLTDSDLEYLKDSVVTFSMHDVSDDYDYSEEIRLGGDNKIDKQITVETGLTYGTNRHEDWKDNLFLAMPANSIGYYYVFDEDIKDGNRVSNSTTLEPFQIDFLGETISIENTIKSSTGAVTTDDPDTITMTVGKKAILAAGESLSVTLAGQTYTVTLKGSTSTGNGKVDLEVTGPAGKQREVITQDTSLSFGSVGPRPLQVRVEDVFDEDGVVNDRATVIVGTEQSGGTKGAYDARRTYDTTNAYIGEDEDDPIWKWHLGATTVATTGSLTLARPILGVRLGMDINHFEEDENPLVKHTPYVGDYVCLPNFFACLVFDRMTESNDDFRWYEVDADKQKDLKSVDNQATADQTNMNVIRIKAKGTDDQGFVQGTYGANFESDTLYIALNNSMIGVWREEQDGSELLPVVLNGTLGLAGLHPLVRTLQGFARLDYGNTQLNMHLAYDTNYSTDGGLATNYAGGEGVIVFDGAPVGTANITTITNLHNLYRAHLFNGTTTDFYKGVPGDGSFILYLRNSSATGFTYLGHSSGDTAVVGDLVYNDAGTIEDISNWEENTRTSTGVIISDPDADNSGDKLQFAIPSDIADYEAILRVARPKQGVLSTTGIGGIPIVGSGSTTASVLVKDTEVLGSIGQYNAVVVGGPCANRVTAKLLGQTFPACGAASGLTEGQAVLELKANGAKQAVLVYGWEVDDTRRAAVLLSDPTVLAEKLSAAGKSGADSVMVQGSSTEVSGITVA